MDDNPEILSSLLAEKRSNNLFNWGQSYDRREFHLNGVNLENLLVDKIGARLMIDKSFTTELDNYYRDERGEIEHVPKDVAKGIFLFIEGVPHEIPLMLNPNNPKGRMPFDCYEMLKSVFFPGVNKENVHLLPPKELKRLIKIHKFFLYHERIISVFKETNKRFYLKKTTSEILDLLNILFQQPVDLTWADFSCSSIFGDEPEGLAKQDGKIVYPYRYNEPAVVRQIFQHLISIKGLAFGKTKRRKRHKRHKRKSRHLMKGK
jgi:hypothetical protein